METTTENILAAINRRNITEFWAPNFNLDMENPSDKLIADAIVYGIQAVQWYNDPELMAAVGCVENIPGFAKIDTMQKYNIVNLDDVFNAITRYTAN